jgi:hypothetical protein
MPKIKGRPAMTMNRITSKSYGTMLPLLGGSGGESGKKLPTVPDTALDTRTPAHEPAAGSERVEEHVLEFQPDNLKGSKITLALRINTRQSGDESHIGAVGFVPPGPSTERVGELEAEVDDLKGKLAAQNRRRDARMRELESERDAAKRFAEMAGVRQEMPDGATVYGPYKVRVAQAFLADLDHFLSQDRRWGEMSLLKAAGMDHRFFARIKAGESFRIESLDTVASAMNKASRGELDPDEFRNIRSREKE